MREQSPPPVSGRIRWESADLGPPEPPLLLMAALGAIGGVLLILVFKPKVPHG